MSNYAKIHGAEELSRMLRMLPKKVSQDVLLRSLRVGANVIRKEAKEQVIVGCYSDKNYLFRKRKYGHLIENIKVTQTKHKRGMAQMTVHNGRAYWGYFLELGTGEFGTGSGIYKSGPRKGKPFKGMSPRPWLTPAFEAKASEAIDRIGDRLGKNIEKAAAILAGPWSGMNKAFRRRLR